MMRMRIVMWLLIVAVAVLVGVWCTVDDSAEFLRGRTRPSSGGTSGMDPGSDAVIEIPADSDCGG